MTAYFHVEQYNIDEDQQFDDAVWHFPIILGQYKYYHWFAGDILPHLFARKSYELWKLMILRQMTKIQNLHMSAHVTFKHIPQTLRIDTQSFRTLG